MNFQLTSISYHFVGDPIFPGLKTLPLSVFREQLDAIEKKYTVISWPELRSHITGHIPLPEHACLLTFDDGTYDHYSVVFPELKARGISGLFFLIGSRERGPKVLTQEGLPLVHLLQYLTAAVGEREIRELFLKTADEKTRTLFFEKEKECLRDFLTSRFDDITFRTFKRVLGRYMYHEALPLIRTLFTDRVGDPHEYSQKLYLAPEALREMKDGGMHFGGHGIEHRWLATASPEEQEEEIASSRSFLETIEEGPYAFSYPYGDYNESLFPMLQAHQYAAAFTGKEGTEHTNPFVINRFDAALFTI